MKAATTGLAVAAAISGCSVEGLKRDGGRAAHYVCEDAARFSVERSGQSATVRFPDGVYRLERRPSSIGERFSSPRATLIIDGELAVFVAEDRLDLRGCAAAGDHLTQRN